MRSIFCLSVSLLVGGAFARDEATFRIFLQECGVTDAAAQTAAVKAAEEKGLLDFNPRTCRPYDEWKRKFVEVVGRPSAADAFVRVWPDPWTRSVGTDPDQAIRKAVKWFLRNGPKLDVRKDARTRAFGAGLILRASKRYNRPEWKTAALELGKPSDERGLERLLNNSVDVSLEDHICERIPHYLREQLVSHDGTLDGAWTDEKGEVSPMMTAIIPISIMKVVPPAESDVTVFKAGTEIDGRVCKVFRIPAFAVAPNGDLVAVCDARWTSHVDLFEGGDISLAVSRSTDHGRTWSAPTLAWKFPAKKDGGWFVSDPSLVTDAVTKEMFLVQNARNPADRRNRHFVFVQKSADNGRTWTKPADITSAFREKGWKDDEYVLMTSGRGIQLKDGTLAFCQNHVDGSRGRLVGSRDHGKTWCVLSSWFGPSTDESKVAELEDGRLMVMSREGCRKGGAPVGHKLLFVSSDRGKTWTETGAAELVSPACNGALLRMNDRLGRDSLVAAVPYARTRQNVSFLVSRDAGRTWGAPTSLWIGPSAYAELADLGGGTVGVLYERGDLSYHDGIGFRAFDIAGAQAEPVTADILWRAPVAKEADGKGYAGWPSLAQLKNGDLIAVWSGDRQHHVDPCGKVRMALSKDGGRTWSAPRTIADTPIDDRDAGVVQLPDGEILVSWFTSVAYMKSKDYAAKERLSEAERAKWYGTFAVRSRDGGATWSAPERLAVPGSAPHGPIALKDGSLLYVGRCSTDAASERNATASGRTKIFAAKSTDGGRSWNVLCEEFPDENGENKPNHQFHEPSVVELANGKLVAYIRYHGKDFAFRRSESTDGGRTWSPMHDTGIRGGQTAPHLLRLADGRVLLTYGNRDMSEPLGLGEIAMVCETAEGKPIRGEKYLLLPPHTPHLCDHGYPATVQRPDGSLYTLCYQADRLNEFPCILGCGWRLPSDERFAFVKGGVLQTEVVCGDSEPERLAKAEFLRVMDAVTGCGTNGVAASRIELKVDPSLGEGDTYSITFTSTKPSKPSKPSEPSLLIRGSNPRSVVFGMMTVLHRLGCRWFWPGVDGEYLPAPTKDLSLPVFSEKSTAAFPYRQLSSHPFKPKAWFFCHNRMNPWTGSDDSRHRVYWGQTSSWGGHSFGWIFPEDVKSRKEYFERFPEQFALWNGKRVMSQHCYTNPDTIRTFQDWILRFWPAHPQTEILNLSAIDTPVHCTCPECEKKDSSTLFFDFVNTITEPARKAFPQKRYSTIAYSFYLKPPKTRLAPDTMMSYCMYNRCYCHGFADETCPLNPRAVEGMRGWREVLGHAPEIYGYHFDVWGGPLAYSAPFAPVLQDEARRARDAGVSFWFTEYHGTLERMSVMRFEAYAFARLAWDPDLDFAALRRDWCRRVYGPAAKPMEACLAALENAWTDCGQHVGGYNNAPSRFVDKFVTDGLVKAVDAQFAEAERAIAVSPDPRAARQIAYEKEIWGRWRELKVSRGNWSALAEKPDPDRLAWFAKCPAGDVVYPREGVKTDWKDLDYVPEFYTTKSGQRHVKNDSLLFGNHPGCFGDQGWINYEVSYGFRFPEEKSQQTLYFRCGGQRLESQKFGHYRLNISRRDVSLHRYDGHGAEFKNPCLVRVKRPLADTDWHTVVVRCFDTRTVVLLDGEKVIEEDILLGGGYVNICAHGRPLGIKDFTIRLLDDPTKEDLRRMKDPNYKPKTFVDGTGKVMSL